MAQAKNKKKVVAPKTANLSGLAAEEHKEVEAGELEDTERATEAVSESGPSEGAGTVPSVRGTISPISGFNTPKIVPAAVSKSTRSYGGPATKLMNELYDAAGTLAIAELPGWERIANIIAKACERLEKAGWRRGKG